MTWESSFGVSFSWSSQGNLEAEKKLRFSEMTALKSYLYDHHNI